MTSREEITRLTDQYSARHYERLPMVIEKGKGVWLYDENGQAFLDMLSCYSAEVFGHRNDDIIGALLNQAISVGPISNIVYNPTYAVACRAVAQFSQLSEAKVLFMNSGAEAVEKAVKIVRKWGYEKKEKNVWPNHAEIIVTRTNFHGRTYGALSASTVSEYKRNFGPFVPGFRHVKFGDIDHFLSQINENTVAYLAEPIQGEGGFIFPPEGYWQEIRKICTEKNILLVFDEIPTAFGRTGMTFPHEYYGIQPDVLILGKALGGGIYPVSAVVAPAAIMDVINPHDDGSTFGGNPLAAAVATKSIEILEKEKLAGKAAEKGHYFINRLKKIGSPLIKEVRGQGLFIGVELADEVSADDICLKLLHENILTTSARGNVVRFTPPLIITRSEIDWAMPRIEKALKTVS